MSTLPDTYHLLRRNGVWYYRRRVPIEHVRVFGASFIQRSLNTTSKAEAKRLRTICDLDFDARIAATERPRANAGKEARSSGPIINRELLFEYVRQYVSENDRRERMQEAAAEPTPQELAAWRQIADEDLSVLRDPNNPNSHQAVQATARAIAERSEIDTASAYFESGEFDSMVRRGLIELTARRLSRLSGDRGRTFVDRLFDASRPAEVSISMLADQDIARSEEEAKARGYSQQGQDKVKANMNLIVELVGPDRLVGSINYDDCIRVRSLLAQIPANRTKFYPKLSISDAIKRSASEGKPTLSVTTQSQYLATFRGLLHLGVLKGLLRSNPAEGLQPLARSELSDDRKRDPFTDEQIVHFLTSDFYRSCAPNAVSPYDRPDRVWRFWLPLICLFMGMRPREVCQSTLDSLQRTAVGTWYIDVVATEDEDGKTKKSLKTSTSRRRVPLHPELLSIGFLEMVQARRNEDSAKAPLLVGLKSDRRGNPATYALKRFRDTFLPAAIHLGPRQTFYSFRHSFRDALRRCDAPPETLQALGGWSQGKLTSSNYGDAGNPDLQRKWIGRVAYPGLDLGFLHVTGADLTAALPAP